MFRMCKRIFVVDTNKYFDGVHLQPFIFWLLVYQSVLSHFQINSKISKSTHIYFGVRFQNTLSWCIIEYNSSMNSKIICIMFLLSHTRIIMDHCVPTICICCNIAISYKDGVKYLKLAFKSGYIFPFKPMKMMPQFFAWLYDLTFKR